jgi:hypothetical protein
MVRFEILSACDLIMLSFPTLLVTGLSSDCHFEST